jgi:hypothetical protein
MSKKTEALEVILGLMPNAKFIDKNGKDVTEDVKKSHNEQTLTELWKKGELEAGWYYVLLFSNEEYVTFIDGNWVVDDRLIGADIKEVLAPVPSYEEWQPFTDPYFRGLTTKDIAELAKKSIRLTTQHCKDNEEIEILREQLDLKNDMVDKLIRENEKLKKLLMDFVKRMEHYKEVKPDVGFIMFDLGYLANQVKEVLK